MPVLQRRKSCGKISEEVRNTIFKNLEQYLKTLNFSCKGQTFILAGSHYGDKHSGKLWSCVKCLDNKGFLMGNTKWEEYSKAHRGKKCSLFMSSQLQTKLTWGRAALERPNAVKPYGCPGGHSFQDSSNRVTVSKNKRPITESSG